MNRLSFQANSASHTILLVEDDKSVRQFLTSVLESLGYRLVACSDGPSALAEAAHGTQIDLLITDVILPGGLHGGEVAENLIRVQPAIKVLFMSGYPEYDLREKGMLRKDALLLQKPFRRAALAKAVHEALYTCDEQVHGSLN